MPQQPAQQRALFVKRQIAAEGGAAMGEDLHPGLLCRGAERAQRVGLPAGIGQRAVGKERPLRGFEGGQQVVRPLPAAAAVSAAGTSAAAS